MRDTALICVSETEAPSRKRLGASVIRMRPARRGAVRPGYSVTVPVPQSTGVVSLAPSTVHTSTKYVVPGVMS